MAAPLPARLALALGSVAVVVGVGWVVLARSEPDEVPTVELVDTRLERERLHAARLAAGGAREVPDDLAELGRDFAQQLRELANEEVVNAFFPAVTSALYEPAPGVFFRLVPDTTAWNAFAEHPDEGFHRATNDRGMREDDSTIGAAPDVCWLVMGDSHVSSVCGNDESFPNLLEATLGAEDRAQSVRVWNVAHGAYALANYLGTFVGYGDLEPDGVVVVVYGGNDFDLDLWRYVYGQESPPRISYALEKLFTVRPNGRGLFAQEIVQACRFLDEPELEETAANVAAATCIELARQSSERDAAFLVVYLPPPSRGQPDLYRELLENGMARVGAPAEGLASSDRVADAFLAHLAAHGVRALDLRPRFAREETGLYWNTDLHLNLAGHEVVAEETRAAIDEL